jgi:ligand-binding sensor domain-containing protein
MVNGEIYLTTPETGLNVVEGTALRPLPGTDRLKGEPYPILLPYDEKRLLVGTRQDGLFLYDGLALERFTTADQSIASKELYRGIVLPDQTFALTTTNSGLIILDRNGRRVTVANRGNGLASDTVYFAMRDREGALWLGLDNGITRVETPSRSPISARTMVWELRHWPPSASMGVCS